jgi:hypothetical protein
MQKHIHFGNKILMKIVIAKKRNVYFVWDCNCGLWWWKKSNVENYPYTKTNKKQLQKNLYREMITLHNIIFTVNSIKFGIIFTSLINVFFRDNDLDEFMKYWSICCNKGYFEFSICQTPTHSMDFLPATTHCTFQRKWKKFYVL